VGVGIFSIQNIALTAAISVPFVAQPAGVRFAISERHHPFIVTVGFLGGGEVWGQASVTVKVKVLCFSKSVTLSIERKFAGDAGDPTFDQMIDPADWEEYCLAFA
jgi:hypothetical protein